MGKTKFQMPTAYTILFLIILVVAILTWFVPAGQYDYVDPTASRPEPIPGTYHEVEANPQGLVDVILAPIQGFYEAVDIALFVIVIGGFLGVTLKTGAIDAGIANVTNGLKGKEHIMIPILMILFGIGGTTYGMAEETIAFYPLIIPVFIAAGYDSMVAVSVILLGAGVGVLGSTVNPFATGIASGFAGVSIGEGIGLRLVMLILGELIAIYFVMRYAKKVKMDPQASLVADMYEDNKKHFLSDEDEVVFPEFNTKRRIIIGLFALAFIVMIYSVIPFDMIGITAIPSLGWWFPELTALFMVFAIIIGLVDNMGEKNIVNSFVAGGADLLSVALIIGISRGITVIMNQGLITDTVLHLGETTLASMGEVLFIDISYLFYILLSFLIPSTSGLATLSMPIMAPLADFAGVSRDLIITSYQSASGIVNLITPTSAVVMGGLLIGRVPYNKWLSFVWKVLLALFIMTILVLSAGALLGM